MIKKVFRSLLLTCLTLAVCRAIRIRMSRRQAMGMLTGGTLETAQLLSNCVQSSNTKSPTQRNPCRLALDNDTSTEWSQCAIVLSAATTEAAADKPWWRGYLENPAYVTAVIITNVDWQRLNGQDGLREFTVGGHGYVCYTHRDEKSFLTKNVACDMLADEIEIKSELEGTTLAICEVQVFGANLMFDDNKYPDGEPLRLDECDKSTQAEEGYCWNAYSVVEGKCFVSWTSVMKDSKAEWWRAELVKPAMVRTVSLTGSKENLINDISIFVNSRVCARYKDSQGIETIKFQCHQFGANVKIMMTRLSGKQKSTLVLCQVTVTGHSVHMPSPGDKRKRIGCFADKLDNPLLNDYKVPVSIYTITVDKCDKMCRRLKKKYFGLNNGMSCWCGSSIGDNAPMPSSGNGTKKAMDECKVLCDGKTVETCGGNGWTEVYELLDRPSGDAAASGTS